VAQAMSHWRATLGAHLPKTISAKVLIDIDRFVVGLHQKLQKSGATPAVVQMARKNIEKIVAAHGLNDNADFKKAVKSLLSEALEKSRQGEVQATPADAKPAVVAPEPQVASGTQGILDSLEYFAQQAGEAALAVQGMVRGAIEGLPDPARKALSPMLQALGMGSIAFAALTANMGEAWASVSGGGTELASPSTAMALGVLGVLSFGAKRITLRPKLEKDGQGNLRLVRNWEEVGGPKPKAAKLDFDDDVPMSRRLLITEWDVVAHALKVGSIDPKDPSVDELSRDLFGHGIETTLPMLQKIQEMIPGEGQDALHRKILTKALEGGYTDEQSFQTFFLDPLKFEAQIALQLARAPLGKESSPSLARVLGLASELGLEIEEIGKPEAWVQAALAAKHPLAPSLNRMAAEIFGAAIEGGIPGAHAKTIGQLLLLATVHHPDPKALLDGLAKGLAPFKATLESKIKKFSHDVDATPRLLGQVLFVALSEKIAPTSAKVTKDPAHSRAVQALQDLQPRWESIMTHAAERAISFEEWSQNILVLQKFPEAKARAYGFALERALQTVREYPVVMKFFGDKNATGLGFDSMTIEQLQELHREYRSAIDMLTQLRDAHIGHSPATQAFTSLHILIFHEQILTEDRAANKPHVDPNRFEGIPIYKHSDNVNPDSPLNRFRPDAVFQDLSDIESFQESDPFPFNMTVYADPKDVARLTQAIHRELSQQPELLDPKGDKTIKISIDPTNSNRILLDVAQKKTRNDATDRDRGRIVLEVKSVKEAPSYEADSLPIAARPVLRPSAPDPFVASPTNMVAAPAPKEPSFFDKIAALFGRANEMALGLALASAGSAGISDYFNSPALGALSLLGLGAVISFGMKRDAEEERIVSRLAESIVPPAEPPIPTPKKGGTVPLPKPEPAPDSEAVRAYQIAIPKAGKAPRLEDGAILNLNIRLHEELNSAPAGEKKMGIPQVQDYHGMLGLTADTIEGIGNVAGAQEIRRALATATTSLEGSDEFEAALRILLAVYADPSAYAVIPASATANSPANDGTTIRPEMAMAAKPSLAPHSVKVSDEEDLGEALTPDRVLSVGSDSRPPSSSPRPLTAHPILAIQESAEAETDIPLSIDPPPDLPREGAAAGMLISGMNIVGSAVLVPQDGEPVPVEINGTKHEARYDRQTGTYMVRNVREPEWRPIQVGEVHEIEPGRELVLVEARGVPVGMDEYDAAPDLIHQTTYQLASQGAKLHLRKLEARGEAVDEVDRQNVGKFFGAEFDKTAATYDDGDGIRAKGGIAGGYNFIFAVVDPESGKIHGFAHREKSPKAQKGRRFHPEPNPADANRYHWRAYQDSTSGYSAGPFVGPTDLGRYPPGSVIVPLQYERMVGTLRVSDQDLEAAKISPRARVKIQHLAGLRASIGMAGVMSLPRYAIHARKGLAPAPSADPTKISLVMRVSGGESVDIGDPVALLKSQASPQRAEVFVSPKGMALQADPEAMFSLRQGPGGQWWIRSLAGSRVRLLDPQDQEYPLPMSGKPLPEGPGALRVRFGDCTFEIPHLPKLDPAGRPSSRPGK